MPYLSSIALVAFVLLVMQRRTRRTLVPGGALAIAAVAGALVPSGWGVRLLLAAVYLGGGLGAWAYLLRQDVLRRRARSLLGPTANPTGPAALSRHR